MPLEITFIPAKFIRLFLTQKGELSVPYPKIEREFNDAFKRGFVWVKSNIGNLDIRLGKDFDFMDLGPGGKAWREQRNRDLIKSLLSSIYAEISAANHFMVEAGYIVKHNFGAIAPSSVVESELIQAIRQLGNSLGRLYSLAGLPHFVYAFYLKQTQVLLDTINILKSMQLGGFDYKYAKDRLEKYLSRLSSDNPAVLVEIQHFRRAL